MSELVLPENRYPVQTFVAEFNPDKVRKLYAERFKEEDRCFMFITELKPEQSFRDVKFLCA
jgi:transcription-repair coupling factor (superfamily II helicase)